MVVTPYTPAAFTPQEIFLVLISVTGCQPQGHSATFRLEAQCLNKLRHRVPLRENVKGKAIPLQARTGPEGSG